MERNGVRLMRGAVVPACAAALLTGCGPLWTAGQHVGAKPSPGWQALYHLLSSGAPGSPATIALTIENISKHSVRIQNLAPGSFTVASQLGHRPVYQVTSETTLGTVTLAPGSQRTLSFTWPDAEPGWWSVTSSTLGNGAVFIPYPAGSLRTGTLPLQLSQTVEGHRITLTALHFAATRTVLDFSINPVPYFPTWVRIATTEDGHPVPNWGMSQGAANGQAVTQNTEVRGTVTWDPTERTVKVLTITFADLGISPSGTKVLKGPWSFRVSLP
jgi:hypothetical protein